VQGGTDGLPDTKTLEGAVQERYGELAGTCCSLSCGPALELARVRPGETVVDLGCGRGRDVVNAAARVGPTGMAIGVDATPAMLERARALVPPDVANVRFLRCDLASLELPDACADVVVSNCTINHAPDKEAVYREIRRVLKPGGRFTVSDIVAREELPECVRADPRAWAACYGGAIPEGAYLAAVRRAGFPDAEVLRRSHPYEKGGVWVLSLTLQGRCA